MKKETSQRKARCIKVLLIPVMLLAICMFSTHTIANETSNIPAEYDAEFPEAGLIEKAGIIKDAGLPLFTQNLTEKVISNPEDTTVYNTVEVVPEFPEGLGGLLNWIVKHINYPDAMAKDSIEGRVICSFIVEPDGSVSNVKVVRPASPEFNKEAARVLSTLPKFSPGMEKGKPVRVRFNVPVIFNMKPVTYSSPEKI